MPSPVDNRSEASNYYDYENAECVGEDPKSLRSDGSPAPVKRSEAAEPATSRVAVDQLVKAASRKPSCGYAEAALTCLGATATAVVGTATGPGDLLLVGILGAQCGLAVTKAVDCTE